MSKAPEKRKWSEIVLKERDNGNVVFLCVDEVMVAPVKEIIKQPTEGLLWDLNRDEVTALSFMDEEGMIHWVNNFAVSLVIRELKSQIAQLEAENSQLKDALDACRMHVQEFIDCDVDEHIAQLEAENERLRWENEGLRKYAYHTNSCKSWELDADGHMSYKCDCGFDALLTEQEQPDET